MCVCQKCFPKETGVGNSEEEKLALGTEVLGINSDDYGDTTVM